MRHGRGANFAGNRLLLKVTQRNVTPDVTVEIEQDSVETCNGIKQLGNVIMRLDLRGKCIPGNAQAGNKIFRDGVPVQLWVSRQVGVVVTYCTVNFTQQGYCRDLVALTL